MSGSPGVCLIRDAFMVQEEQWGGGGGYPLFSLGMKIRSRPNPRYDLNCKSSSEVFFLVLVSSTCQPLTWGFQLR